jgi:diguanylate cyclase (GGDEF)-like protein
MGNFHLSSFLRGLRVKVGLAVFATAGGLALLVASQTDQQLSAAGSVVAALALAVLVLVVLGRVLFGPLNELRIATRRIKNGQFGTRLRWSRADELGVLARDIDDMAQTLEEHQRLKSRFETLALEDSLTGLLNHRAFLERLTGELNRAQREGYPVSLVALDIDYFKEINDELGHAAGDQTLREVAQLLLKQSRGINVIARYGGDEFVVFLVETTKAGARLYAERMRQAISAFPVSHGRRLTASFGIANVPEDTEGASEEMVRAADDALYAAKRAGKNQVATYDVAVEKTTGFSEKAG